MSPLALDHVQLAIPAGGEDEARAFWCGLLGLEEQAKPPELAARGGLWLRLAGGIGLHLGVDPGFRPATRAHPGLAVADFDALIARLAAAGIGPPVDRDHAGRRRAWLADPFGNRIELVAAG